MRATSDAPKVGSLPLAEKPQGRAPRPPLKQAFRALRNPNYRLFWFGQVISSVGSWMQIIAQSWLVLRLTNSPLALGIVTTCQTLPVLLLVLFGGVIADRVPKRRLLLITQTTMLLQATLLAVLTAGGWLQLGMLYALAAVLGTANALDNPARQAFVKELVGPDDVPNAVALNSIIFNSARLIGPALGGITIAAIGVQGCFALNAVSFLAVLGGLLLMRPERFYDVPSPPRGRMLAQIAEGLRYAVRTPDIALPLLLMAVIGTFGYNFQIVLPLIAQFVLHASSVGFGVLTSAMAVGSLIAALGIAYSGRVTQRTLLTGAAGFSALLFCLSITHLWPMTLAVLVALGVFSIVFTTTANSRLQIVAPPHLRGRVMSLYMLLFMGSTPIGSLVIGTLAERQGVRLAIAEVAIACMLGTVTGLLYSYRQRTRLIAGAEMRPTRDTSAVQR